MRRRHAVSRWHRRCYPLRAVLVVATLALVGCGEVSEETVTLRPVRTASILETSFKNFGICNAGLFFFVDRRPIPHHLWPQFLSERDSRYAAPAHLTGYEILVDRGESCHLIAANKYQAAVAFDLSGLPSTAIVSARLNVGTERYGGVDPPVSIGSDETCRVLIVGQATEAWESGVFPDGEDGMGRDFIASRPARPAPGPYNRLGPIDVTNTVSEWARGTRPNHGFVITPDRDAVAAVASTIREGGVQCPLWITDFSLDVTVATTR